MRFMPGESIYQDAAHYDWLASFTAPQDLPFYRRLATHYGSPILELGCGTGRVSVALAKDGYAMTGIDLSSALLEGAGSKANAAGVEIRFEQADMRDFQLDASFGLAICPYNAFNHLLDFVDVGRFLSAVARHLRDDGRLVIDTIQPDPAFLGANPTLKVLDYVDPASGKQGALHETNDYDARRQVNSITWRYLVEGELVREDRLEMRMFFPQELNALIHLCGWEIEEKWGNYAQVPFGARTPKQLLVCAPKRQ